MQPPQPRLQPPEQLPEQVPPQPRLQLPVQSPPQPAPQVVVQLPVQEPVQVPVQVVEQVPVHEPVQSLAQTALQAPVQSSAQVATQLPVQSPAQATVQLPVHVASQSSWQEAEHPPAQSRLQLAKLRPMTAIEEITIPEEIFRNSRRSIAAGNSTGRFSSIARPPQNEVTRLESLGSKETACQGTYIDTGSPDTPPSVPERQARFWHGYTTPRYRSAAIGKADDHGIFPPPVVICHRSPGKGLGLASVHAGDVSAKCPLGGHPQARLFRASSCRRPRGATP